MTATRIVYTDPRRFGLMDLFDTDGRTHHKLLAGLGLEPLGNEFNAEHLPSRFRRTTRHRSRRRCSTSAGRRSRQYLCLRGAAPRRACRRIATPATLAAGKRRSSGSRSWCAHIRGVLDEAIAAGGSTLRDYAAADGEPGAFQQRFAVYDREGEPCPRPGCRGTVRRIVQAGRSTFYCPVCQR